MRKGEQGATPAKECNMDEFKYPVGIWFYGRPYDFSRFTKVNGVEYAVYRETELGVEQAFTPNQFKYNEYYGNIERRG